MKVVVSVGGRFHGFNLAAELARRGHLHMLITSYPAFIAARFGVPRDKVRSVIGKEIMSRVWRLLPAPWRRRWDIDFWLAEYFDQRAAKLIPADADLFVGWSFFSLHAIRRAKELGIPTIVDHGSSHIEYQRDILNEEYARFGLPQPVYDERPVQKELKEYAEADHIALGSKFAVRTFVEKGIPEKKIIRVPYGVDISSFKQTPKNDDVFRVAFAGGLTLRKGVHYLLRAFHELKLPKSELLLVGTIHDEIRPFLAKYKKNVRAIGSVPQTELAGLYSDSSVFVLDSVEDGFGMVIIQAMACGLPVIASENTGGPDIIEDGKEGFILPIRDIGKLKEKLLYLYKHPEERAKMGTAALAKAAAGFTWQDYGERMLAAYSEVLRKA